MIEVTSDVLNAVNTVAKTITNKEKRLVFFETFHFACEKGLTELTKFYSPKSKDYEIAKKNLASFKEIVVKSIKTLPLMQQQEVTRFLCGITKDPKMKKRLLFHERTQFLIKPQ